MQLFRWMISNAGDEVEIESDAWPVIYERTVEHTSVCVDVSRPTSDIDAGPSNPCERSCVRRVYGRVNNITPSLSPPSSHLAESSPYTTALTN